MRKMKVRLMNDLGYNATGTITTNLETGEVGFVGGSELEQLVFSAWPSMINSVDAGHFRTAVHDLIEQCRNPNAGWAVEFLIGQGCDLKEIMEQAKNMRFIRGSAIDCAEEMVQRSGTLDGLINSEFSEFVDIDYYGIADYLIDERQMVEVEPDVWLRDAKRFMRE